MTTTDRELDEFHPLVQQKKAKDMMVERKHAKIQFVLSWRQGVIPCEWIDPFMGVFHKIGETGMITINGLPKDSLIIGQHFVELDTGESPCKFCNSMGVRCPDDSLCDVYTAFKETARK
jgi:hypothetical protein